MRGVLRIPLEDGATLPRLAGRDRQQAESFVADEHILGGLQGAREQRDALGVLPPWGEGEASRFPCLIYVKGSNSSVEDFLIVDVL